MFPEYVEKYNQQQQQQLSAQIIAEKASQEPSQLENSKPLLDKVANSAGENDERVDVPRDRRKEKKQPFPTWMMLLLVSIFGIVMALPLLQL